MAEGYQAGTAYTQVLPDFRNFHKKISESLDKESVTFERFGEKWGDKAARAFAASFDERLRAARPVIKPDVDTREVDRKLDRAARNRESTITVKTVIANAGGLAKSKGFLGLLGGAALGPSALGLGAIAAGGAVAGGAALGGLAAFGTVAKSEVTKVQAAQKALLAAQKQFTTAQAAYAAATTKAGRASALAKEAAALKAEKAAVAGLTPAERQLGKEITGLAGAWSALGKAQSPVIASGLAPWVSTATRGLALLSPVITDTGNALQFLGNEADQAIQSPFWKQFSAELARTAGVGLLGFGNAIGHVADGLGHLFVTFAPDIQKIPALVDKAALSFDHWAQGVHSGGLDKFLSQTFSKSNVASLKSDLGSLAKILENTAKATASFSPTAFTGLSNVLSILAKLSPGQIEAIGAIYAIGKLGGGAGNLASVFSSGLPGLPGGKPSKPTETEKATEKGTKAGIVDGLAKLGLAATLIPAAEHAFPNGPGGPGSGWNSWSALGTNLNNWFVRNPASWARGIFSAPSVPVPGITGASLTPGRTVSGATASPVTGGTATPVPGGTAAPPPGGTLGDGRQLVQQAAALARSWLLTSTSGAAGWLPGHGRDAAAGFAQGFTSGQGIVFAAGGRSRGWLTQSTAGAGGWLQAEGRAAAYGFAGGYLSGGRAIESAAARTHGWVNAGIGNPAGWLVGAGESVMGGFLRGLLKGWNPVTGFLGGIAGWIVQHKGPLEADRKMLVPHGIATMTGYHEGLMRGWEPGMRFVSSVAPKIAAATPLPGVGRTLQPGQLQLQVTYGSTGNALTDAIVRALRYEIGGQSGGDVQRHLGQGKART